MTISEERKDTLLQYALTYIGAIGEIDNFDEFLGDYQIEALSKSEIKFWGLDDFAEPDMFEIYRPPKKVAGMPNVGRNSPCPCGSGKKYKRCCGKG